MTDESLEKPYFRTHYGFCDESKYNTGRYRAVSIVSISVSDFKEFNDAIENIIDESDVDELKWYDLTDAKMRFAAIKAIDCTLEYAKSGKIRVDTLIWDIEDSRHRILKRDDLLNLQKMYYHLLRNVIIDKWSEPGYWNIYPDEQSATDWEKFGTILERGIRKFERQMLEKDPDGILFKGLNKISQTKSHECTAVQIADLYAGLGVHSYESLRKHVSYYIVRKWKKCKHIPKHLRKSANAIIRQFSRSDRERCQTLHHFHVKCRENRWAIHLLRTRGLRTTTRQCPINFWLYTPQSELDKAPTKMPAVISLDRDRKETRTPEKTPK